MKSAAWVWMIVLGLGATVGWQIHRHHALQDRLTALETNLEDRGAVPSPPTERTPELASGALPRRIDGLQSQVAELRKEMGRVAKAATKQLASVPVDPKADLTVQPQFRDAVRNVVLDLTDDIVFRQKLGGQVGRLDLGKNASFATLADTLKLNADQEEKVRADLMVMKEDVMMMLTQERDDGVDVMAKIREAEQLGEGDPKKAKLFMSLFTLKVPGSEHTYWDQVVKMQTAFRKRTDQYLSNEQVEIFNAIKVDLLSVEVE